jgi:hypothetical protein
MDYGGRGDEEELFKITQESGAHDDGGDDGGSEDGSQFLNNAGEGMELEARDEGQTRNVGALTKSSEIY